MIIKIIVLGAIGVVALFAWWIRGAQVVDDQSELRLSKKGKRSPIQLDYKHLANKKPSNDFDAGALTGAAVTLIILSMLLAFTAPAHADVFVDVGLSVHRQASLPPQTVPGYVVVNRYDIPVTRNPYGVLAIGYQQHLNQHFNLSIAARHESSIPAKDHGTDSLQFMLRWMPRAQL